MFQVNKLPHPPSSSPAPLAPQQVTSRMENKAMYLSTYEERESGSTYEDSYEGQSLSKLQLCDDDGEEEGGRGEEATQATPVARGTSAPDDGSPSGQNNVWRGVINQQPLAPAPE